jgi:hypothetical protein
MTIFVKIIGVQKLGKESVMVFLSPTFALKDSEKPEGRETVLRRPRMLCIKICFSLHASK